MIIRHIAHVCTCACVCVCFDSHCSEHTWRLRSEVFSPGKKSIFALTQKYDAEEAGQQYAVDDDGCDDDDDDDDVGLTVTDVNRCETDDAQGAPLVHSSAPQLNVDDDIDSVLSSINDAADES